MERCLLLSLLLSCALSVSARDYCTSVALADKEACCAATEVAGTWDPSCPSSVSGQCAADPMCCADKLRNKQYDPSCPIGNLDIADSCAMWPPPHRNQCCNEKAAARLEDPICTMLTSCGKWSDPTKHDACCVRKTAAVIYEDDGSCPQLPDECITFPPGTGPLDRGTCCIKATYDPACPLVIKPNMDCAFFPPQHRQYCCQVKAGWAISDAACPVSAMAAQPCTRWPLSDLPFCCAVKAANKVVDVNCQQSMSPPKSGGSVPTPPSPGGSSTVPGTTPPSPGTTPTSPGTTPMPSAPVVCDSPCGDSCIISLPKVTVGGKTYLLGLVSETEPNRVASADMFCKGMGYGGAGTSDNMHLLPQYYGGASAWATYDPVTSATCNGPACPVVGVVECVKAGGKALAKDGKGNVGCNNTGSDVIGSNSSGSHVRGNNNSGSDLWGDNNSGSGVIGSGNTRNGFIGNNDQPFTL